MGRARDLLPGLCAVVTARCHRGKHSLAASVAINFGLCLVAALLSGEGQDWRSLQMGSLQASLVLTFMLTHTCRVSDLDVKTPVPSAEQGSLRQPQ